MNLDISLYLSVMNGMWNGLYCNNSDFDEGLCLKMKNEEAKKK